MADKKSYLYVGKATRRFLEDPTGPVTGLELDCLRPHVSGTVLESIPSHLARDVVFPIHNLISGLDVFPLKGGKWNIPKYPELKELYQRVMGLNRKELFLSVV